MVLAAVMTHRLAEAYYLVGPGGSSCGTWTADQRTDRNFYPLDPPWALGFLSGVGYMGNGYMDPLNGLGSGAVTARIDNFCQAHPLEIIAAAAEAFVRAHRH